jgi:hypothetical protein
MLNLENFKYMKKKSPAKQTTTAREKSWRESLIGQHMQHIPFIGAAGVVHKVAEHARKTYQSEKAKEAAKKAVQKGASSIIPGPGGIVHKITSIAQRMAEYWKNKPFENK